MNRSKTFVATGIAPDGRLFAGDLNLIQDLAAALTSYTQTIAVQELKVGDSGLGITKFGTGEFQVSGSLRTNSTGILKGLGGLFAGTYTTTQRNAISLPLYGLLIQNTTTNQLEQNKGTPSVPDWQPVAAPLGAGSVGLSHLASNSVDASKVVDGSLTDVEIATANKNGAAGTFGMRTLGTGVSEAASGADGRFPTSSEKLALLGTSGAPGTGNRYVTDADARVPTQNENDALLGTDGSPNNGNRYVTGSEPRLPTQGENDALQGTSGSPSNVNRYVTDADGRMTNSRNPTGSAGGILAGSTYPNPTIAADVISAAMVHFKMQGGFITNVPASGSTIFFPTAFPIAPVYVTATKAFAYETGGVNEPIIPSTNVFNDRFDILHASGNNQNFYWVAFSPGT